MELYTSDINRREIYRYLGYQGNIPDEPVTLLIQEVLDELLSMIRPRYIYKVFQKCTDISAPDDICLVSPQEIPVKVHFTSRNLSDNLCGCTDTILMAATLGIEADKLLHKYELLNMARASVLQACSAACIEAYCNKVQEELRCNMLETGMYLRPRFSPGYGDLPLSAQIVFFQALDITKRLGVTLTDSLLMYPTKSVTAFIGMTPNKESCHIGKCNQCNNEGCEFRNEDT